MLRPKVRPWLLPYVLWVSVGVASVGCDEPSADPRSEEAVLRSDMRSIQTAAEAYRAQRGECPPAVLDIVLEGLAPAAPNLDPWGREFQLSCEDGRVSVRSAGPDGRWDSDDDVLTVGNPEPRAE